jgi:hypothetical protein
MDMNEFDDTYDEVMMDLNESTSAHFFKMMHGLNPSVKTIGIITAENPMGEKLSRDENKKLNNKLKDHLGRGAYGYFQIKGRYNSMEHPFIVQNIKRKELLELGRQFRQDSVIYGNVSHPMSLEYEFMECFTNVVKSRAIFKRLAKDVPNFYSEFRGRKFNIPFFQEDQKDKKFIHDINDDGNAGIMIEGKDVNAYENLMREIEDTAMMAVNDKYVSYKKRCHLYLLKEKLKEIYGVEL